MFNYMLLFLIFGAFVSLGCRFPVVINSAVAAAVNVNFAAAVAAAVFSCTVHALQVCKMYLNPFLSRIVDILRFIALSSSPVFCYVGIVIVFM